MMCVVKAEPASAKSNLQIAKELCRQAKRPMKLVPMGSDKVLHRKGKKFIVVEKIISYSSGKRYGLTKQGWYIGYNKKVPKGKKVISYFIYNPNSNAPDDYLWIVDNKTYR